VIEIATGLICDSRVFKNDYIILANHSGVQLHKEILAITSVQNQCIHLFHIKPSGVLVSERVIGWHNFADDELIQAQYRETEEKVQAQLRRKSCDRSPSAFSEDDSRAAHGHISPHFSHLSASSINRPAARQEEYESDEEEAEDADDEDADEHSSVKKNAEQEQPVAFSGLKHRIMAYLYRRAQQDGSIAAMREFYMAFEQYVSLVMWRMQFIGDDHILIKFGNLEQNFGRYTEPTATQSYLFVLYCLSTSLVEGVYESSSEDLLYMFENCSEMYDRHFDGIASLMTHPGNNIYSRQLARTFMQSVKNARSGG
jgi:hypothetical protein